MNTKELFESIRNTPGTNDKVEIIKANLTDELINVLKYTYTRDRYHVRPTNIDTTVHGSDDILKVFNDYPKNILDSLKNNEISGNEAVDAVTDVIKRLDDVSGQIFLGILDHNLKLGVSSSIMKELGMEDKFEVALAMKLQDQKNVNVFDGSWFVSRKLDGCVSGDTEIEFENGDIKKISDVVENKIHGKIKSYDEKNDAVVYSEIEDWMHNVPGTDGETKEWFSIELENGKHLEITGNDKVYVKNKGWTRVDDLAGDEEVLFDENI